MAHDTCCCIDLEIEESSLTLDVGGDSLAWGADDYVRVVMSEAPEYEGPYEATPAASAQTFRTTGKLMTADFTVAPIPTNYGLVTYDGTTIHIS